METNAFLLFEIDFRDYLHKKEILSRDISLLLEQAEKRIQLWKKYGAKVFPTGIQMNLDERNLRKEQRKFLDASTVIAEARTAEIEVKTYLKDVFGNLNIKKHITTSNIILCCNELGISIDIFDYYVSYREKRDQIIKIYPIKIR